MKYYLKFNEDHSGESLDILYYRDITFSEDIDEKIGNNMNDGFL